MNGIDNALSQVAAAEADKVRDCLQPVRQRLLDIYLPAPKAEAPPALRSPNPFVGTLVPGNDPNPSGFLCAFTPDALGIYFGSGLATLATRFPNTGIKILDKGLLVLNRDDRDENSIDLHIYSEDGRPIATILNNQFELNEHNF